MTDGTKEMVNPNLIHLHVIFLVPLAWVIKYLRIMICHQRDDLSPV